ncbi:Protein FAR-RED IMPAIRED RESPONSE [Arachis hypogaea]|nr:Protein FAR-RED IMPAIRED RESPONSE [Arachis hypogaea]
MFSAIRNLLSNTCHRWCIWNILKKIPHKFGRYVRYRKIHPKMTSTVWNARSVESFKKDWTEFIAKFKLEHNRWLSSSFCHVLVCSFLFFQGEFWAGMKSTQRSEKYARILRGFLALQEWIGSVRA